MKKKNSKKMSYRNDPLLVPEQDHIISHFSSKHNKIF